MTTATNRDTAGRLAEPIWIREKDVEVAGSRPREGIDIKDLPFFDTERGVMLRAAIGVVTAKAYSPRHHHTFDQVRYFIRGRTKFGKDVISPGDCMYFPEGAYYGPQEAHNGEDCLHITLQFPGPSATPYPNPFDQRRAVDELKGAGGTFEKGIYTSPDGRKQDGFDALLEHLTGAPVEYPRPRIDRPVAMHTDLYEWQPLEGVPGAAVKHLGFFNEAGPNLKLLKLDAGASTPANTYPWQEVRFVVEGGVIYGGEEFCAISCGYLPADAPREETIGAGPDGAVLFVMQLSVPGGKRPAFSAL
jgi:mannose-6-phosphate isomerase-like protein (cupin superfamily)